MVSSPAVIVGNLGGSGLRLTRMIPHKAGSGVFVPDPDTKRVVVPGGEVADKGASNVFGEYVPSMSGNGLSVGIAGPVLGGVANMTWLNASLSEDQLRSSTGLDSLLFNDMPPVLAALRQLNALSELDYFADLEGRSPYFVLADGERFSTEKGFMVSIAPGSGTGVVNGSISDSGKRLHIYSAEESHRPMGIASSKLDELFFQYLRAHYGYPTEEIATRNSTVKDAFDFWVGVAGRYISLPSGYADVPIIKEVLRLGRAEEWILSELRDGRIDPNKYITDVALRKYGDGERSVFCEIAQAHVIRNIGLAFGSHALKLPEAGLWLTGSIAPKIESALLDVDDAKEVGELTFRQGYLDRESDKFNHVVGQHRVTGVRTELAFDLGLAELFASQNKGFAEMVGFPDDRIIEIF